MGLIENSKKEAYMNIGRRIVIVLAGLFFSWVALWGASDLSTKYIWTPLLQDKAILFWKWFALGGFIVSLVGSMIFARFIEMFTDGERLNRNSDAFFAGLCVMCFAFMFGAIVAPPSENYVFGIPMVIGILPMVFVVKEIATDVWRKR